MTSAANPAITHRHLVFHRWRSLSLGIFLMLMALVVQTYASAYVVRTGGNFVGDIILDNLPIINLSFIYVECAFLLIIFTTLLVIAKPRYILFTLKAVAFLIIIRSFFISVTHLGIYPHQIILDGGFFDRLFIIFDLQAGYFFSGHTAFPLMMMLIFWREPLWRYFFLIMAFVFGASVLLSHVHYSIDVFAAPFMVYSIFKLAEYWFPGDRALCS